MPISHTRDTPGRMAPTVADVALLDAVIAGDDPGLHPRDLRGVRLGVDRRNFFEDLDPQTDAVAAGALRRLREREAQLIEVEIPDLQALNAAAGLLPIGAFEAGLALPKYLAANDTGVSLDELVAGIASPDVGDIVTDVGGTERVDLRALGGRDRTVVADLSATEVRSSMSTSRASRAAARATPSAITSRSPAPQPPTSSGSPARLATRPSRDCRPGDGRQRWRRRRPRGQAGRTRRRRR